MGGVNHRGHIRLRRVAGSGVAERINHGWARIDTDGEMTLAKSANQEFFLTTFLLVT